MTTAQQLPNYIRTDEWTYTNSEGEVRTIRKEIVELEITLGRETRKVEFEVMRWEEANMVRADNCTDFFARIGMGEKSHACTGSAWIKNGKWEFSTSTTALNRQAHIIGFRDNARDTNKSQHSGSKIAKGVK